MIGDAIDLYEVNTPCRILSCKGIIVGLRGWMRRIKAIVVRIPWTDVRGISRVRRTERRACDRKISDHRFPRYATDNVNPKAEAQRVQIIREGPEREILFRRRETRRHRNVATIRVH